MAGPIQQTTQINLPNPRTPLIRFQLPNGPEVFGYPTREFMALLRQLTVRVGGTGGDVDIITPDSDILPPLGADAGGDAALGVEPLMLVSGAQLQEMVSHAVAVEVQMALASMQASDQVSDQITKAPRVQDSPLASEMTMGRSA
ncbi:hypothetical protein [Achromobacter sp. NFACC18-2]|uniref:hypothetical protein n=1 Tax=Achromobacter sp. NFACC18-2 TaxID=1564112 RepID=UPI0008D2F03D|nr:hypothetical protein [Achromobacter sp. NFACC18-2]SEK00031.1 hypothetical protein SAMN03159494_04259 [Achromobacter sp. NFACC18-2]